MKLQKNVFWNSLLPLFVVTFLLTIATCSLKHDNPAHAFRIMFYLLAVCMLMSVMTIIRKKDRNNAVLVTMLPLMMSFLFFTLYLTNARFKGSLDSMAARYLPLSIIQEKNLDLDEFPHLRQIGTGYFLFRNNTHVYPKYPVGAAFLALPVYVIALIAEIPVTEQSLEWLERISASVIACCSILALFYIVRCYLGMRNALLVCIAYAAGTNCWSTSSQALWQHGASQLFICLTILCLIHARSNNSLLFLAGFTSGVAILCRPTNALMICFLTIYVLIHFRKRSVVYLPGLVMLSGLILLFNYHFYGSPMGSYGFISGERFWQGNMAYNAFALLFNPNRGLFVFSPFLVFSLAGIFGMCRRNALYLAVFMGMVAEYLVYCRYTTWWGGHSYGPRLLSNILPSFVIFLVPFMETWSKKFRWKSLFYVFVCYAIVLQGIGVFTDASAWNSFYNVDYYREYLWNIKNGQIAYGLKKNTPVTTFPHSLDINNAISRTGEHYIDGNGAMMLHADQKSHGENYLLLGCFTLLKPGSYRFSINARTATTPGIPCLRVEVYDWKQEKSLVQEQIRQDNQSGESWHVESFDFHIQQKSRIEYKIYFFGAGDVWVNSAVLFKL